MSEEEKIDPDPWTMISVAIAAVSMVGTLASVALQFNADSRNPFRPDGTPVREHVVESLERAIKTTEKLLRFLQKVGGQNPAEAEFSYGASAMMLSSGEFTRYDGIQHEVANMALNVQTNINLLLRHQPEMAAAIGQELLNIGNVAERINGFYRDKRTNEEVLGDCLFLLRTFTTVIERIGRSN